MHKQRIDECGQPLPCWAPPPAAALAEGVEGGIVQQALVSTCRAEGLSKELFKRTQNCCLAGPEKLESLTVGYTIKSTSTFEVVPWDILIIKGNMESRTVHWNDSVI